MQNGLLCLVNFSANWFMTGIWSAVDPPLYKNPVRSFGWLDFFLFFMCMYLFARSRVYVSSKGLKVNNKNPR